MHDNPDETEVVDVLQAFEAELYDETDDQEEVSVETVEETDTTDEELETDDVETDDEDENDEVDTDEDETDEEPEYVPGTKIDLKSVDPELRPHLEETAKNMIKGFNAKMREVSQEQALLGEVNNYVEQQGEFMSQLFTDPVTGQGPTGLEATTRAADIFLQGHTNPDMAAQLAEHFANLAGVAVDRNTGTPTDEQTANTDEPAATEDPVVAALLKDNEDIKAQLNQQAEERRQQEFQTHVQAYQANLANVKEKFSDFNEDDIKIVEDLWKASGDPQDLVGNSLQEIASKYAKRIGVRANKAAKDVITNKSRQKRPNAGGGTASAKTFDPSTATNQEIVDHAMSAFESKLADAQR